RKIRVPLHRVRRARRGALPNARLCVEPQAQRLWRSRHKLVILRHGDQQRIGPVRDNDGSPKKPSPVIAGKVGRLLGTADRNLGSHSPTKVPPARASLPLRSLPLTRTTGGAQRRPRVRPSRPPPRTRSPPFPRADSPSPTLRRPFAEFPLRRSQKKPGQQD